MFTNKMLTLLNPTSMEFAYKLANTPKELLRHKVGALAWKIDSSDNDEEKMALFISLTLLIQSTYN